MSSQIIPATEQQRIAQSIGNLRDEVTAIEIRGVHDAQQYAQAGDVLARIKGAEKTALGILKPYVDIAKRAWEDSKRTMDGQVAPFGVLREHVSRFMEDYAAEERRKAQAEQDRINEDRRREQARIAEEERKAAEAKAAEERKEREKEIERQRKAGELKKKEADRLAREAREQEAKDREAAKAQEAVTAASVAPVTVKAAIPTVAGIRRLVLHKFRITNPAAVPRTFCTPDEVAIGQHARNTKGSDWIAIASRACPGVEFFEEDSV